MQVLVDTSVWSKVLRSRQVKEEQEELIRLINDFRVVMIGPIRQEILSGLRYEEQFMLTRDRLRAFEDIPLTAEIHELAAQYFNACRAKGVQGSHIDFMICAVSVKHEAAIYSLDKDFSQYASYLPIQLHTVGG